MKKLLVITLLLLTTFVFTSGFQTYTDYKTGKILTSDGNTITCWIKIYGDGILLSDKKITYRKDAEKLKIELKDVKAVFLGDKTYHVFPAYSYDESNRPYIDESKFFRIGEVIVKGNVELLQTYTKFAMPGSPMPYGGYTPSRIHFASSFFLVKENRVKVISKSTFDRSVRFMFSDCEVIAEKMDELKYTLENMIKIVIEGNKVCFE